MKPNIRITLRMTKPARWRGVRRKKARWSLLSVRFALRIHRSVADCGRLDDDSERRRHAGEDADLRGWGDSGSSSSIGRASARAVDV